MQVQARRVFRLALTSALALACGYGLGLPLPFLAPLFALLLTAAPGPPIGPKGLLGLIVVVLLTLGLGLLVIPLLQHYPLPALLIVALGLYFSSYLTVGRGKGLVGALLTVGFTMISAAGNASFALAVAVIHALVLGIGLAILCHWVVYPWFPEDAVPERPAAPGAGAEAANWISLRATLIVLPAYLLALTDPSTYMATIMKSVSLGQQATLVGARDAGRELLGSTFLAGCCAVLFWGLLGIAPHLWTFFWVMLLFGAWFAARFYRVAASRFSPSFWLNTATTMLILLGPAVQDSANGKDVYMAFAVRMALFLAVTLYALSAIHLLEHWRARRRRATSGPRSMEGATST